MSGTVADNFENGIFWELYLDLERQFQSFLEYVPYLAENEGTYSFKLLNLILNIGGYVDSAFKEMARYPKFFGDKKCKQILGLLKKSKEDIERGERPKFPSIKHYLETFDKLHLARFDPITRSYISDELSKMKVIFKRLVEREDVIPFKPYNQRTNAPEWWEIYNGLKHDVSLNIEKANLKNTRDALAGAFLLNVIHEPAFRRLFELGILKLESKGGTGIIAAESYVNPSIFEQDIKRGINTPYFVETPLFIYKYLQ